MSEDEANEMSRLEAEVTQLRAEVQALKGCDERCACE